MSTIVKMEDGTFRINNGTQIIGKLIPVGDLFQVRMGEYGGFYANFMPFDKALSFLMKQHIRVYSNKIESIRRSALLIYKKSLKHEVNVGTLTPQEMETILGVEIF